MYILGNGRIKTNKYDPPKVEVQNHNGNTKSLVYTIPSYK